MSWDLRRYIGTLDTYVFMTDVDALSLAAITELNIPGLNVETSSVRQYNTTLAAHILGTIGKMDGTDWETYESKGYAMDAYIGKDGLEQAFEEELHGSDGTRVTTITADGNILEEHYAVDPVAGNNIETTIDLGLQKVAGGNRWPRRSSACARTALASPATARTPRAAPSLS